MKGASVVKKESVIEIFGISVQMGEKAHQQILVGELANGNPIYIPLMVLRGSHPGPALWMCGAIHGDELNGLFAMRNVYLQTRPEEVKGSLIFTPILNPIAFVEWKKEGFLDSLNLDQQFPGKADGLFSQRIAAQLFLEMKEIANAVISFHAPGTVNYAPPYTMLAFTHLTDIRGGRSKSPRKSMALAEKFAQKALQLDDSHPMTRITLGQIHLYKRQHEKAIAEGRKALALSPNGADVHNHLGFFLYYAGRYEEAVPLYEKAIRLNPYPPIFYYHRLGSAYANVGRYDEAIDLCKKTLKRAPNYTTARLVLAMVYIWQGREEEAHAEVAEVLRINPSFTLKRMKAVSLHKNKADLKRRIEALRKAGLPE